MAPGGHRQWPLSIKPLLDRLSWIVLKTRPLALKHLREALQDNPEWKPRYRRGPRIELVPAVPYKFVDIGTKMGHYHIEELISRKEDKNNILHPRHVRSGIPPVNSFHSVLQNRWETTTVMLNSGVSRMLGLMHLRHVTSELLKHLSTDGDYQFLSQHVRRRLVMMKLRWISEIPREWIDITTNSLEAWSARDELSPFHTDNRRGYARVTPIACQALGYRVAVCNRWTNTQRMLSESMTIMRLAKISKITYGPHGLPWKRSLCKLTQHCKP